MIRRFSMFALVVFVSTQWVQLASHAQSRLRVVKPRVLLVSDVSKPGVETTAFKVGDDLNLVYGWERPPGMKVQSQVTLTDSSGRAVLPTSFREIDDGKRKWGPSTYAARFASGVFSPGAYQLKVVIRSASGTQSDSWSTTITLK